MIKRILPLYLSGWFYLALVFWLALIYFVSTGGLNTASQYNVKLLELISPNNSTKTNLNSTLENDDILTLHATFEESDAQSVETLLSYQKNSQLVILGKPSKAFIKNLKRLLNRHDLNHKIIINAYDEFSEKPLAVSYSMFLSGMFNWFRFNERENVVSVNSEHFIYSPLLLNHRQSYPLLWQHQDEIYASLITEVLHNTHGGGPLSLEQKSQLILKNNRTSKDSDKLYLGFNGEVFTASKPYHLDHNAQPISERMPYFLTHTNAHLNDKLKPSIDASSLESDGTEELNIEIARLASIQEFLSYHTENKKNLTLSPQYKVIILTNQWLQKDEILKPVLVELSQKNYLTQGLLVHFLTAILFITAIALIWFIQHLSVKQQLTCIIGYIALLLILQSIMFNQQQWLEILPVLLITTITWLLFLAYQKEDALFSTTLIRQAEKLKSGTSPAAVIAKHIASNQKLPGYKSPQNFSPSATMSTVPADDFEKTMLMDSAARQSKPKNNHHITVENFGRYQVEGILGKGAMGIVYQGVDPKINRHVAIKTLQLATDVNSQESKEAKDRFFREAQTAGGLSHANIVTIYDVGEENNLGYIAMDLLTGAPLSVFTQPGQTLPTPLVYQLLIQITDALEYAHKQKVVHRDIKPANIIFDDDLIKVTVTDFGIAYVSDHSKTRTGVIMGSPYYMSPEQILGLKVDGRSDIFSLGVTFYQLLCGHLPFEGESIATVAYQITKAKPTAVNIHNSELPASALRITNKAMHKDIEKRYQTMAEFKLALVNALKRDYKITVN